MPKPFQRDPSKLSALVVDHDPHTRHKLREALIRRGFEVEVSDSVARARAYFHNQDLIVSDTEAESGHFVRWLRMQSPEIMPYVVGIRERGMERDPLSSSRPDETWDEVILSPFDDMELETRLKRLEPVIRRRGQGEEGPRNPFIIEETGAFVGSTHFELEGAAPQGDPPMIFTQPEKEAPQPEPEAPAGPSAPSPEALEWKALLDAAPYGLVMLDRDLNLVSANQLWNEQFRVEWDSARGRPLLEVFPGWRESLEKALGQALKDNSASQGLSRLPRSDGEAEWVRWRTRPCPGGGGVVMSSETVTSAIENNQDTQFKARLGGTLLGDSSVPAVLVDLRGVILAANRPAHRVADDNTNRFTGTVFWKHFVADSERETYENRFRECVRSSVANGQFEFPSQEDLLIQKPDGELPGVSVHWALLPWKQEDGELAGILFVGTETETEPESALVEKLTEAEKESNGNNEGLPLWLEEAVSLVPFGLALLGPEEELRYINPQHEKLLGTSVTPAGGLGAWISAASPDEAQASELLETWRTQIWQKQLTTTFVLRNTSGELVDLEFRPVLMDDGGLLITIIDVSDIKRSHEAVGVSEAKFRALFQHVPLPVALMEADGGLLEANPAFEKLAGRGRWDLRQMSLVECVYPEDRVKARTLLGTAPEDLPPNGVELRFVAGENPTRWARVKIGQILSPSGNAASLAVFAREVTEERELRRDLIDCQYQNKALLEIVPDTILLLDQKGHIEDLFISHELAGSLPEGVWKGQRITALWTCEDEEGEPELTAKIRQGGPAVLDCRSVWDATPGQSGAPFEMRVAPAGEGHVLVLVRRKLSESGEASVISAEETAPSLDAGARAEIRTNLKGRIEACNPTALALLGYELPDLEGKGLAALHMPGNEEVFNQVLSEALNSEGRWESTVPIVKKDGSRAKGRVLVEPVEENGALAGLRETLVVFPRVLAEPQAESLSAAASAAPARNGEVSYVAAKLLRVHHLVKSELNLVNSALKLELEQSTGPEMRDALRRHEYRLQVLGLLHDIMEQTAYSRQVPVHDYVSIVARHLGTEVDPLREMGHLKAHCDVMNLDPETALVIGWLIVEAVAAWASKLVSQKHDKPTLEVAMRQRYGECKLRFVQRQVNKTRASLVLNPDNVFVKTLVERLQGSIVPGADGPAGFTIRFSASAVRSDHERARDHSGS